VANQTDICNLALSRVGAGFIDSLDEPSAPAELCRLLYPIARDATLRDHDWNFARKRLAMATLDQTSDQWDYVYLLPADCLAVREIYNPSKGFKGDRIPYELGLDENDSRVTVLTDEYQAILIYTKKVTNASLFDSKMTDALAWRLASDLAQPLRGDIQLGQSFLQQYARQIGDAKATNANEHFEDPSDSSVYERSRL
jgi:hypothetical protein